MTEIAKTWASLKTEIATREIPIQFSESAEAYRVFAIDGVLEFVATIYRGEVPYVVARTYSQEQNDADLAEFEGSYKSGANRAVAPQPALEDDRRLVVVNFPADTGSFMWLCGRGDDLENGVRGMGQPVSVSFADVQRTEPETKTIDLGFLEQVQLHDGQLFVRDPATWEPGDEWSFSIHFPATEFTENQNGTGNANVIEGVIIPAAGDGAIDVDLDQAVPVPAGGSGFWAYDVFGDALAPSPNPGAASWHLLAVEMDAYFMRSVPIPWQKTGTFDFDAYKAERIAKRWRLRLAVSKVSSGPGVIAGWLVVFREVVT